MKSVKWGKKQNKSRTTKLQWPQSRKSSSISWKNCCKYEYEYELSQLPFPLSTLSSSHFNFC